jgi:hypothetical protein
MATIAFEPANEIEQGGLVTLIADGLARDTRRIVWDVEAGNVVSPTQDATPQTLVAATNQHRFETKWDTAGLEAGSYVVSYTVEGGADDGDVERDRYPVTVRPISPDDEIRVSTGDAPTAVTLQRSDFVDTEDQALWVYIRGGVDGIRYERYAQFIDWVFCGVKPGDLTPAEQSRFDQGKSEFGSIRDDRNLPFPDIEPYRLLKAATEVFLMVNSGVSLAGSRFKSLSPGDRDRLGLARGVDAATLWQSYLKSSNGFKTIPYLELVRRKLGDVRVVTGDNLGERCYGVLRRKFTNPCLLELIWSYWQEEGMLVQTLNAISLRFQNRRSNAPVDALAELEIDPLRPLNNLLWGYIQDEPHRLTVRRRAYEYQHHYGLSLYGRAVPDLKPADSRSRFLEAFHTLLHKASVFYKEDDDTTMIADPFPVLNALRDVHLLLAEGAHNQYGDLPWTARLEMLMQQWLLARPEMRQFLPTRTMVVYPEPWMDRVDAMKRLQNWTDMSVRHFRDLAVNGEPILLSIRFGNWSDVTDRNGAANWARFWRQEVQWYIQSYQSVTGVDLTTEGPVETSRVGPPPASRFAQPALHLSRRLDQQKAAASARNGQLA